MNIGFTEQQTIYIQSLVESGDYQNASEVVRDAMRLHKLTRQYRLDTLRAAVQQGWDGPDTHMTVDDIIARKLKEKEKSQ